MTDDAKLTLLHSRLIKATKAGRLSWDKQGEREFMWSSSNACVVVDKGHLRIYDDRGVQRYSGSQPMTSDLMDAIVKTHEEHAVSVIDAILVDLESKGPAA